MDTTRQNRLTEDENWLLTHIQMFGSDAYPVHKLGKKWTWGPVRGIKGPPIMFGTKREAVKSFEGYMDILIDKFAGRLPASLGSVAQRCADGLEATA